MSTDHPAGAPRLRFAPSPTGYFHVGGARTALWNWLVARRTGGTFILRIEDTDAERNRPEWTEGIQSAMRWLGLDWDEGPYFQSERSALYAGATARLRGAGRAYVCDCTRDAVDARAAAAGTAAGAGYDGFCRDRGLEPGPGRALRFATPREGTTRVVDLIRGEPVFENRTIEDFVVQRGDGSPTFILANVVDDLDMGVTHVVRGEEHLPNTPKAVLLWQALAPSAPLPVFAHVAVLVNEKRQKLSKRRDKVALEDYRAAGFLADAMRNYLVLLGWSPGGDREFLTVDEMVAAFRLEDVSASPAFFDVVKLTHFNAEYIRRLPVDAFVAACEPWLTDGSAFPAEAYDRGVFARIAPFVQERTKLLADVAPLVDFLFLPSPVVDEDSWQKAVVAAASARDVLDGFLAGAGACAWEAGALKALVEEVGAAHGLKLGKAQAPVRVAVTGRTVGPPLFEALEVLGREASVARVRAARERLG